MLHVMIVNEVFTFGYWSNAATALPEHKVPRRLAFSPFGIRQKHIYSGRAAELFVQESKTAAEATVAGPLNPLVCLATDGGDDDDDSLL